MRPIEDLFKENHRPPLLLGKGPTFDMRDKFLLPKFFTIALNHVAREVKADLCSIIDIDVFADCGEEIYKNSRHIAIPWHPHHKFRASEKNLEYYLEKYPVLDVMDSEDRVFWYNLSTFPQRGGKEKEGSKTYAGRINNGDTFYGICAANGAKTVYGLGIDGGKGYSSAFKDLTPLTNGRASFDDQNPYFKKISRMHNSEFIRLGDKEDIMVFVGSEEKQLIPSLVLDYSIKKHTFNPSVVAPLHMLETKHKTPIRGNCRPRTPFSFKRFFIPQLTSGKAFYLDSDMLVFKDMADLLDVDFNGNEVLYAGGMDQFKGWKHSNFAMLLIDCDNVSWNMDSIIDQLDAGTLTYEQLMFDFKHAKTSPDLGKNGEWNSLDHYVEGETALLHYTNMATQPWVHKKHKYGDLWQRALQEAVMSGFIDRELVLEHQRKGHIRTFINESP